MKKNKSNKNKINIIIYLILRILIVLSLIFQAINNNWNDVFLCILALLLFTLPDFVSIKYNVTLPNTLEIIVYLFIFSSAILGEIQNFYETFPYWDTLLHTLSGFICAGIGFSLIDILNNSENLHITLTPAFVALVAFCFSMTIGIIWEFIEYSFDKYLDKDMQKDYIVTKINTYKINDKEKITIDNINKTIIYNNDSKNKTIIENGYLELGLNDTIKDLFVNFLGAIVFSILGYLYIKNRDNYKFTEIFIPKLKSKIE